MQVIQGFMQQGVSRRSIFWQVPRADHLTGAVMLVDWLRYVG